MYKIYRNFFILQGPLCDFKVYALGGHQVDCHLLVVGTFSPWLLELVHHVGGDSLILPEFALSDLLSFMNLAYSAE